MAHDVFISYSADDKPIADAMCSALESKGIRCWIAPRDILPGMDWGSSIIDAIAASRVMVLLLSSNSNVSSQVKREVERAINKEVIVIPFRIEDVRLSKSLEYHLSLTHWMDALTPPLEAHLETLAEKIRQLLLVDTGAGNTSIRNVGKIPIPPLPSAYKRRAVYLGIGLVIGLIALLSLVLWVSVRSRATPESATTAPSLTSPISTPKSEPSNVQEKGASNKKPNVNNNAAPDTGSQPRIPVINGKTYDVARKMLIKEGWQPNVRRWSDADDPSVQGGNGPTFWKRGYREVVACAGTGAAECRFEFFDPNQRVLIVITEGEEDDGGKYHAVVSRVVFKK